MSYYMQGIFCIAFYYTKLRLLHSSELFNTSSSQFLFMLSEF